MTAASPIPAPGFRSVTDLDPAAIRAVIARAAELKAGRVTGPEARPLAGRSVVLLFEKPSLRTRISFEVGIHRLGGQAITLTGAEVGLGKREAAADVARVIERYADAIVARVFRHGLLDELAARVAIPVVNALSDTEHPCQALADLMVIGEHLGALPGRRLVYVGDGNNVAASLLLACASVGMHIRVVSPAGYAPDPAIVARARALAAQSGSEVEIETDPAGAARGADAVYTDAWASMGQEDEAEARRVIFAPYRVTEAMLATSPGALFLHCLPAHRGEEAEDAVLDGPRSVIFDQAEDRLWVQMALLERLIAGPRAG